MTTKTLKPKDDVDAAWMRKLRSLDRVVSKRGNLWTAFEVIEILLYFGELRMAKRKAKR